MRAAMAKTKRATARTGRRAGTGARSDDPRPVLAKADRRQQDLAGKAQEQQQVIRELQARIRELEGAVADRDALRADLRDLKDEVRELTRANREQARRCDALLAENARLKAGAKIGTMAA